MHFFLNETKINHTYYNQMLNNKRRISRRSFSWDDFFGSNSHVLNQAAFVRIRWRLGIAICGGHAWIVPMHSGLIRGNNHSSTSSVHRGTSGDNHDRILQNPRDKIQKMQTRPTNAKWFWVAVATDGMGWGKVLGLQVRTFSGCGWSQSPGDEVGQLFTSRSD